MSNFESTHQEILKALKTLKPDFYNNLVKKHEFTFDEFIKMISEAHASAMNYTKEEAKEHLDEEHADAFIGIVDNIIEMCLTELMYKMADKYERGSES